MSDTAESIPQALWSGVTQGLTYGVGSFSAIEKWASALEEALPPINDCRVCGDEVVEYEVCYDCEQGYYPPREYWQEVAA